MRIKELFAWAASVCLLGGAVWYSLPSLVLKPSFASEVADEEIARVNAATPKTHRKPLLPADVKVLLGFGNHGSAVHIGNGLFLTAEHLAKQAPDGLSIKLKDGTVRKGRVLWLSSDYDIALLRVDGSGLEAAEVSCIVPPVGTEFTLVGNPRNFEHITTFGRVAGDEIAWLKWKRVVPISAPSIPGQSGGGVYGNDGKLIGIFVGLQILGGTPQFVIPTGYGVIVPGKVVCDLLARA